MSTYTEYTSQHKHIHKSGKKKAEADIDQTASDTNYFATDIKSTEVDTTLEFKKSNFEQIQSASSEQLSPHAFDVSVFGNGKTGEEVKLQDPDQELDTKSQPQRARRKYVRGSRPARVTRISIEHTHEESSTQIKPRLKNGVLLSAPIPEAEKSLIIATAHRAITIHHPGA